MKENISSRLLILDFGHPMNSQVVETIKTSLLNVASLISSYSSNSNPKILGISIINSGTIVIKNATSIQTFYKRLIKLFNSDNISDAINVKVTIQEYQNGLTNSLVRVMRELNSNLFTSLEEDSFQLLDSDHNSSKIQLAIVTNKNASVVLDMAKDVINKLLTHRNLENLISHMTPKIIQITEDKCLNPSKPSSSSSAPLLTCGDTVEDLNNIFKNFLFKTECEHEEVSLIISKELNLIVKCDLYDCIVDPALLRFEFTLCNDFLFRASKKHSFLGLVKTIADLEVTHRIPISGLCPTLKFGLTRRVCATESRNLNWTELKFNRKIFKALCQNLAKASEGLLAQTRTKFESSHLKSYYFLTSDGNSLLLHFVAPEELHLSNRFNTEADQQFEDEESAHLAMEMSLQRIQLLQIFSPKMFPSGFYDCLRAQLASTVENGPNNNDKWKWIRTKHNRKRPKKVAFSQGEAILSVKKDKREFMESTNPNIHPALLSPKTIQKYRKLEPSAYQMPELRLD